MKRNIAFRIALTIMVVSLVGGAFFMWFPTSMLDTCVDGPGGGGCFSEYESAAGVRYDAVIPGGVMLLIGLGIVLGTGLFLHRIWRRPRVTHHDSV